MSRLDLIDDWIEKARTAQYNPARLAALCWVSDRHLRRHFVKATGQSVQRWLSEVRVWEAIPLLLQGYKVGAVSADLHFSTPSHFSTRFHASIGASPSSFPCDQCAIQTLIAHFTNQRSVNADGPAGSLAQLRASVLEALNERMSSRNRL